MTMNAPTSIPIKLKPSCQSSNWYVSMKTATKPALEGELELSIVGVQTDDYVLSNQM